MTSSLIIFLCFVVGGLISLIYFSGLWRTVHILVDSPHPFRLLFFSFAVRLGFAVGGLYIIMDGSWERLASAMIGFLIVRAVLIEKLGQIPKSSRQGATAWK